jgi:hypothetical protein
VGALLIRVPVVVQVSLRADLRLREGLVVVVMGGLRKPESESQQLQVVLSVNLNALLLAMALCYLQAGPPWLVSRRPR